MANGTEKPIRSVKPGDLVLSAAGYPVPVAEVLSETYYGSVIGIGYQDEGAVTATASQVFLTDRGLVDAELLVPGDRLQTPSYGLGKVLLWDIEVTHHIPFEGDLYYLVVACDDTYVAGGVSVKHGRWV